MFHGGAFGPPLGKTQAYFMIFNKYLIRMKTNTQKNALNSRNSRRVNDWHIQKVTYLITYERICLAIENQQKKINILNEIKMKF